VPDVTRIDAFSVSVRVHRLSDDLGSDMTYELYQDATGTGCSGPTCVIALAPGASARFKVVATSSKPGVASVTSDDTQRYTQYPDAVGALNPLTATPSTGTPAGQGTIGLVWPAAPAQPSGITAVQSYQASGPGIGAPGNPPVVGFGGLAAGSYQFSTGYCVEPDDGVWVPPGPGASLCAASVDATVELTTLPAAPVGCAAERTADETVQVSGCGITDGGGVSTGPAIQHSPDNGSTWLPGPAPGGVETVSVAPGAPGGTVLFRVENTQGASPTVAASYAPIPSPLGLTSAAAPVAPRAFQPFAAAERRPRAAAVERLAAASRWLAPLDLGLWPTDFGNR
jgi:hypothetical protein